MESGAGVRMEFRLRHAADVNRRERPLLGAMGDGTKPSAAAKVTATAAVRMCILIFPVTFFF